MENTPTDHPRAPLGKRVSQGAAFFAIATLFLFHLANLMALREDFPFTSASMFARYIDDETTLYAVELFAIAEETKTKIEMRHYRLNRRILLYAVYCSDEPNSPYRRPNCVEQPYTSRMQKWFEQLARKYIESEDSLPDQFVLELIPRQGKAARVPLGTYDCESGGFTGWHPQLANANLEDRSI